MCHHNNQAKVAVINDLSGFGRCSLSVSIPIISTMKLQCCPIPTGIFSNHTGFESFHFSDHTHYMEAYMKEWKKLDLHFEGIATGFLCSIQQIELVKYFFHHFQSANTITLVDPVMGDDGKLYPTYSRELAKRMSELVPFADILTPNLTEACFLTNRNYHDSLLDEDLLEICQSLEKMGPSKIVISGIKRGNNLANYVYETGKKPTIIEKIKVGTNRSGTGDVFAAILIADAVRGLDFSNSVMRATNFIQRTIARSIELQIPTTDGICFEEFLNELSNPTSFMENEEIYYENIKTN